MSNSPSEEDVAFLNRFAIPSKVDALVSAVLHRKMEDPVAVMRETLGNLTSSRTALRTLHPFGLPFHHPDTSAHATLERHDKQGLIAAKVNGITMHLHSKLFSGDVKVEPIFINQPEGMVVYRRSLCFLLAAVCKDLFPNRNFCIEHCFGLEDGGPGGYYCTLGGEECTTENIEKIYTTMRKAVEENLTIEDVATRRSQDMTSLLAWMLPYTASLVQSSSSPQFEGYRMGNFLVHRHFVLAPSTGILQAFELQWLNDGFLMRCPSSSSPMHCNVFTNLPVMAAAHDAGRHWARAVRLECFGEVNEQIMAGKGPAMVALSEAAQDTRVLDIARTVVEGWKADSIKVVIVCGLPNAGAPSFTAKLSNALKIAGVPSTTLAVDDYCRQDVPDAELVPELIHSLRLELLSDHMAKLFEGEDVEIPVLDQSTRSIQDTTVRLHKDGVLLLHGRFCFHPQLLRYVPTDKRYHIYVAPLLQTRIDDLYWVSHSSLRLLRRIVKGYVTQQWPAERSFAEWAKLQHAGDVNVVPHLQNADVVFNSAAEYELSVLKVYAEPLLVAVKAGHPHIQQATELMHILGLLQPLPAASVPSTAILREFIGGSTLMHRLSHKPPLPTTPLPQLHLAEPKWVDLDSQSSQRTGLDLVKSIGIPSNLAIQDIIAVYVNEELLSLNAPVTGKGLVRPLPAATADGLAVYHRTLCFMLHVAARTLFPDRVLHIYHGYGLEGTALGSCYLTGFGADYPIQPDDIGLLRREMTNLISADVQINVVEKPKEELIAYFDGKGEHYSAAYLRTYPLPNILCSELNGFYKISFGPLAPSTGRCEIFALSLSRGDLVLHAPAGTERRRGKEVVRGTTGTADEGYITRDFWRSQTRVRQAIGVRCAGELNQRVLQKDEVHVVQLCEMGFLQSVMDLAGRIYEARQGIETEKPDGEAPEGIQGIQIVIVSGPAASGKTAVAHALSNQLKGLGLHCEVLSTDNYYFDRSSEGYPLGPNNVLHMESIKALQVSKLRQHAAALLEGEAISVPLFDKPSGTVLDQERILQLPPGGLLILEGPNAFHDDLLPDIPRPNKFKVVAAPLASLPLDELTAVPCVMLRLCRHLAQKCLMQGNTPQEALQTWHRLRVCEDSMKFMYRDADAVVCSAQDYELAAFAHALHPLWASMSLTQGHAAHQQMVMAKTSVGMEHQDYTYGVALAGLLAHFAPIKAHSVPNTALLRGFVGGQA